MEIIRIDAESMMDDGVYDSFSLDMAYGEDENDFEIQIFWASTGVTPAEMYANPELSGSIYDIVISADKAYSKKR